MSGRAIIVPFPWTFTVGLARTGIAVATLVTLAATPTSSLFRPLRGPVDAPDCDGLATVGLFCVSGAGGREIAKWAAVAALLVIASGWRPRITAVPHWWLAFSVFHGVATPDGGDQIASVVALALIPYCLLDPRRWHWSRPDAGATAIGWRAAVAASALVAVKVQASFLYFQAAVSKLSHQEWADGTAIYYYLSAPNLGAASWWQGPLGVVYSSGPLVALLTWGPLVVELTLALTLLTRRAARGWLFAVGVGFHSMIALTMGLWSFSTIMVCVLLLLTVPIGSDLHWHDRVSGLVRRRTTPTRHLDRRTPRSGRTRPMVGVR